MNKSPFQNYKDAKKRLQNGDIKTGKDLLIKTLEIDSDFYSALCLLSEIDNKLFKKNYLNKTSLLDSSFNKLLFISLYSLFFILEIPSFKFSF